MIPNIAIVHIDTPGWRRIWRRNHLWIPIFLLWIPFLILLPFILLVVIIAALVGRLNPWTVIRTLWGLLCALPGTDVRVVAEGNLVMVRIL
ncbi:MAG TPA: hypothetical protein VIY53_03655 [Acidobacteriaceae bacterium]